MRTGLVALAILTVAIPFRASLLCGQTQGEVNEEACSRAIQAESQLEVEYQRLVKEAGDHGLLVQAKLRSAQDAWKSFRDAEIGARYPLEEQHAYGTVLSMCQCAYREKLARERTQQLQLAFKFVEGDVCSSTL
jgi:uncharacterized protein YecT (DUF1311 family)